MKFSNYKKAIASAVTAAGIIASSGTLTGRPELILNSAVAIVGAIAVYALRNTDTKVDVPQASSPLGTATIKVVADLSEFEQQIKRLAASIHHAKPADNPNPTPAAPVAPAAAPVAPTAPVVPAAPVVPPTTPPAA